MMHGAWKEYPTATGNTRLDARTSGFFVKKITLVHQTQFKGDVEHFGSCPDDYRVVNQTWWKDTQPSWLMENVK
jgi:hypothetical protein